MFEVAELGRTVSPEEFGRIAPALRVELLDLQQKLRTQPFPAILLFAGVDGAGKSESLNLLSEWLDPRWIVSCAYGEPSDEERERPEFWRFWRDLPPRGQIGLFLSSWYSRPVVDRVYKRASRVAFENDIERIAAYETALAEDGALILKFWMHLSEAAQKDRLRRLERDRDQSWRVSKRDWQNWKNYGRFIAAAEKVIARTGTAAAPWMIVEGADVRYRSLTVLSAIRDALKGRLNEKRAVRTSAQPPMLSASSLAKPTILDRVDLSRTVDPKRYGQRLMKLRARLALAFRAARKRGISSVLVFEGWDAAGKGGVIRRMLAALDVRDVRVIPIAAPTDEERAHHYLWRFWRHLPRAGRLAIFDRSWYGRVLVERVESFARPDEWMRAYKEINDFEAELARHGVVLMKYWLHISPEEQFKRFKERARIAHKRWKLTSEDWRNREKRPAYELAANDMIERTSTEPAPWTPIAANDKLSGRLAVIESYCKRLETALART